MLRLELNDAVREFNAELVIGAALFDVVGEVFGVLVEVV